MIARSTAINGDIAAGLGIFTLSTSQDRQERILGPSEKKTRTHTTHTNKHFLDSFPIKLGIIEETAIRGASL